MGTFNPQVRGSIPWGPATAVDLLYNNLYLGARQVTKQPWNPLIFR